VSGLPKIKIIFLNNAKDYICELEQVKLRLDFNSCLLLIDGKRIHSYDELAQLASQEQYKDKEFIEAVLMPVMAGG
jgi:hypothetical protein